MSVKFSDLETPADAELLKIESSLSRWYRQVRNVEIEELEVGDLCRAVRQKLFLPYVLPVVLRILSHDITEGELFDGELVELLAELAPENFDGISIAPILKANLASYASTDSGQFAEACERLMQLFAMRHA